MENTKKWNIWSSPGANFTYGTLKSGLDLQCSQALVVLYLLAGLAWAVLGFLWIFGAQDSVMEADCGYNSFTYWVGREQ